MLSEYIIEDGYGWRKLQQSYPSLHAANEEIKRLKKYSSNRYKPYYNAKEDKYYILER